MLFLPSPLTSTGDVFLAHVHADFYEKAKKYVENGGFLYASVASDAAVPEMTALFGARLSDTITVSEVTLKVVEPFGGLKPGDTFHYAVPGQSMRYWGSSLEVKGGQVIAVDQDGRPALVAHELGKGKTLLSAYPIEAYLASQPSGFEQAENTHRIYEAFREWTGWKPQFRSEDPNVEVSALPGQGRGYLVIVNHSEQDHTVNITTTQSVRSVQLLTPDGAKTLTLDHGGWKMDIPAYDGAIVEWK
jgi:hypothetical protein